MRITAGTARGRKLVVPAGRTVRPTSDKVRQAIFNSLESQGAVRDAVVLDMFCGSGALGLEALSRGAARCTFFDKSPDSFKVCKQNVAATRLDDHATVFRHDATKIAVKPDDVPAADLVFLDPPYHKDLFVPVLKALLDKNWLAPEAVIVIECEKEADENLPAGFTLTSSRSYGDTKVLYVDFTD